MKNMKVCSIVVTYNRKKLLVECLEGLLSQKGLEAIILVDNASTDGTYEYLREAGYNFKIFSVEKEDNFVFFDDKKVYYIRLNKNTGGSGGFHYGLKVGYQLGYDWYWLMDDDVIPLENALEKMLNYSSISKCIHPSKKFEDGEIFKWEGFIDLATGMISCLNDLSFKNGKSYTFVNNGCFEGMLIHRSIIEKIGFPDKRFFIAYDDTIYGLMASFYTNVIYISDICLLKKRKRKNYKVFFGRKSNRVSDMFLYYKFRNKWLVFEYLEKLGTLKKLEAYRDLR